MKNRATKNDYFSWLYDQVYNSQVRYDYWLLLSILHDKEFYWLVANDDNRISDGKKLREIFIDDTNYNSYEDMDGPCSMLEMLIALADRFNTLVIETNDNNQISRWFWEMITNLGLSKYTNDGFTESDDSLIIDRILNRFLERGYHRNGQGGLFPLKHPKKNQTKVEIWYQMCAYLLENYYVDWEV